MIKLPVITRLSVQRSASIADGTEITPGVQPQGLSRHSLRISSSST